MNNFSVITCDDKIIVTLLVTIFILLLTVKFLNTC